MKPKLLAVCIVILISTFISNKTFAQRDAGGSSSGSPIPEPCPTGLKRNNGDGTCGGSGQIRLSFGQSPTYAPTLIHLWYDDGTPVTNIILPVDGDITDLASKGYISYCLQGGNIPPSKKIVAQFYYPNTNQYCGLNEK